MLTRWPQRSPAWGLHLPPALPKSALLATMAPQARIAGERRGYRNTRWSCGFYRIERSCRVDDHPQRPATERAIHRQRPIPIIARSNTEFSYKDKTISFITDLNGQTASLILHQYGIDMPMKRIDAATAQRITSVGGRPTLSTQAGEDGWP